MVKRDYYELLKMDKVVYVAGVVGPLSTLPQLWNLYILHHGAGVSAATWIMTAIVSTPLLLYGIKHKLLPVIIQQSLWVFFQTLTAIGAIIYG